MPNLTIPTPIELAFEPINLCNARCFCCPYTYLEKDKEYRGKRMSEDQVKTLIDDFASGIKEHNINPKYTVVKPWRYSDPLVNPYMEMVFDLCQRHNLKVNITTNAVSFTERKCKIIKKYIDSVNKINISIIGFNKEEIKKWMDIDWDVTKERLKFIKEKYPEVSRKMIIGVKHKIQRPTREHWAPVVEQIQKLTLGKVKKKADWLESRVEWNGFETDGLHFPISEKQFVQGCTMVMGKILRTLEVLVDGQAVLCCDDATGKTNFGNVFEIGVKGVWKNLGAYHREIFSNKYTESKKNMICNTCSRAKFKWDANLIGNIAEANREYIN
jgi:hypothetical protein